MSTYIVAVILIGQYPSPQGQPSYLPASTVYAVSMPAAPAPNVVTLGAGQVWPAGPIGQALGHIGRKLEKHSWPRVQPITAQPAAQTVYVAVQQPVMQAAYAVPQPLPQLPVGIPQQPAKAAPAAYGSPQQAGYGATQPPAPAPAAPRPSSEAVPPVPNR